MTFMYEAGAPVPGVILEYMDFDAKDGQLVIFYKDARGTTIENAVARAKAFIATHPVDGLTFRLGGGTIGTTAALNDEIAYSDQANITLIIVAIYVLVSLSYQSFVAGNMVMTTLVAAGVVSFLYIGLKGIGMNINTLPVTAVGMGIGVDYILYVVDRIKREYGRLGDADMAIKRAVATSGMAVTFTATTLVGRRDAVVLLVQLAILGGDGDVARTSDADTLARRHHASSGDLFDRAAALHDHRSGASRGSSLRPSDRRVAGSGRVNAGTNRLETHVRDRRHVEDSSAGSPPSSRFSAAAPLAEDAPSARSVAGMETVARSVADGSLREAVGPLRSALPARHPGRARRLARVLARRAARGAEGRGSLRTLLRRQRARGAGRLVGSRRSRGWRRVLGSGRCAAPRSRGSARSGAAKPCASCGGSTPNRTPSVSSSSYRGSRAAKRRGFDLLIQALPATRTGVCGCRRSRISGCSATPRRSPRCGASSRARTRGCSSDHRRAYAPAPRRPLRRPAAARGARRRSGHRPSRRDVGARLREGGAVRPRADEATPGSGDRRDDRRRGGAQPVREQGWASAAAAGAR